MPESYHKNHDRWLLLTAETDWKVCLWTDTDCPMPELLSLLSSLDLTVVQVADIMRLAIVYVCGGMYVDTDIIPVRLPQFPKDDRLNIFRDIDGDKNYTITNAVIAAPERNSHVADLLFRALQTVKLSPETHADILLSGADIFKSFPEAWYGAVEFRNRNHYSPVSWPQARVLNIAQKYTYEQWLTLAESFLQYPEVYGVHTFDSTWVYVLNEKLLKGTNGNEPDATKSAA